MPMTLLRRLGLAPPPDTPDHEAVFRAFAEGLSGVLPRGRGSGEIQSCTGPSIRVTTS